MPSKLLKKSSSWLVLILCVLVTACSIKKPYRYQHFIKKHHNELRLATYNINWGDGIWKKNNHLKTIAAIKHINADILLLQENTPKWKKFIKQALNTTYKYQEFRDYENAGGLAILSKYPFHTIKYIPKHPTGWHPALLVLASTPLGKIQILNLHLSPSVTRQYTIGFLGSAIIKAGKQRSREIRYLYQYINPQKPTIIAGDFNEGPDRKATQYLEHLGYSNALNIINRMYHTWQWKKGFIHFASRMDHVFYSPEHLTVSRAQILYEGSSDHFPVVVDFVRKG
jgi:endonuclease/exonuclease/phosphatase family metal-dependent hydrolase